MADKVPSYDEFARRAQAIAEAIPPQFMADVEDVVVHRGVRRHPQIREVVTLGECESSPVARAMGAEEVRSIVHLWYGSFVDLAKRDPTFDVDAELRETIEHEVKHHLEDKAGTRSLEDEDDLFDAHARFVEGLPVPAGWYRRGEEVEPGVWAVEGDLFVEVRLRRREFEALRGTTLSMKVLGEPIAVEIPADAAPGEPLTFEGEGLAFGDEEGESERSGGGEDDGDAGDLHLVPLVR